MNRSYRNNQIPERPLGSQWTPLKGASCSPNSSDSKSASEGEIDHMLLTPVLPKKRKAISGKEQESGRRLKAARIQQFDTQQTSSNFASLTTSGQVRARSNSQHALHSLYSQGIMGKTLILPFPPGSRAERRITDPGPSIPSASSSHKTKMKDRRKTIHGGDHFNQPIVISDSEQEDNASKILSSGDHIPIIKGQAKLKRTAKPPRPQTPPDIIDLSISDQEVDGPNNLSTTSNIQGKHSTQPTYLPRTPSIPSVVSDPRSPVTAAVDSPHSVILAKATLSSSILPQSTSTWSNINATRTPTPSTNFGKRNLNEALQRDPASSPSCVQGAKADCFISNGSSFLALSQNQAASITQSPSLKSPGLSVEHPDSPSEKRGQTTPTLYPSSPSGVELVMQSGGEHEKAVVGKSTVPLTTAIVAGPSETSPLTSPNLLTSSNPHRGLEARCRVSNAIGKAIHSRPLLSRPSLSLTLPATYSSLANAINLNTCQNQDNKPQISLPQPVQVRLNRAPSNISTIDQTSDPPQEQATPSAATLAPTFSPSGVPTERGMHKHWFPNSERAAVPDNPMIKPYGCGEPLCIQQRICFASPAMLKKHHKILHKGVFSKHPFRCGIDGCNKSWKNFGGMQYHWESSRSHRFLRNPNDSSANQSPSHITRSDASSPPDTPPLNESSSAQEIPCSESPSSRASSGDGTLTRDLHLARKLGGTPSSEEDLSGIGPVSRRNSTSRPRVITPSTSQGSEDDLFSREQPGWSQQPTAKPRKSASEDAQMIDIAPFPIAGPLYGMMNIDLADKRGIDDEFPVETEANKPDGIVIKTHLDLDYEAACQRWPAETIPSDLHDGIQNLPAYYRHHNFMATIFQAAISSNTAIDEPIAPGIEVINDLTNEGDEDHDPCPPWEFYYTNRIIRGNGVPPPAKAAGCDCIGACSMDSKTCRCAILQRQTTEKSRAYDKEGLLVTHPVLPIFECHEGCQCSDACMNRVVQNGRKCRIQIKKTRYKGWGVFSPDALPRGTYIGTYSGELLLDFEADKRADFYDDYGRTYIFNLDSYHLNLGGKNVIYAVDAFHVGNFTRFLNHSCEPNCRITPCYTVDRDFHKPLLTIFTCRDIKAGEELCFSYAGDESDDDDGPASPKKSSGKRTKTSSSKEPTANIFSRCHCGARKCKGYMWRKFESDDEEEDQ